MYHYDLLFIYFDVSSPLLPVQTHVEEEARAVWDPPAGNLDFVDYLLFLISY